MNTKKEKKWTNKKYTIITVFVISLVLSSFSIFLGLFLKQKNATYTIKNSVKEIGVTHTIKGKKNDIKYHFKLPYFQVEEIDRPIYQYIENELSSYIKEHKDPATIQSDYSSYAFNNNYGVSVNLQFLKKNKKETKKSTKTFVFCYGKEILIDNIFSEDKIKQVVSNIKKEIRSNKKLAKYIKDEGVDLDSKLQNDKKTLQNFVVKENSIEFYFNSGTLLADKYGIVSVDVPNSALKETFSKIYYKINPKEDLTKGSNFKKSKKPLVALTFDDGPSEETTKILDVFEKYDSQATFFVLGKQAKQFPEVLKRQISNGHEIANHTFSHANLTKLSEKNVISQIEQTNSIVEDIIKTRPKLVRAPYGSVNQKIKKIVPYPLIYWSIDTRDWQTQNDRKTIDAVVNNAQDGDIILMHDTYANTAKAVETIVPELINRGFCLVGVSEMFKLKNLSLEKGTQYISAKNSGEN